MNPYYEKYGRTWSGFLRMYDETRQHLRFGQAFVVYFTKAPYTNPELFYADTKTATPMVLELVGDWQIPVGDKD